MDWQGAAVLSIDVSIERQLETDVASLERQNQEMGNERLAVRSIFTANFHHNEKKHRGNRAGLPIFYNPTSKKKW